MAGEKASRGKKRLREKAQGKKRRGKSHNPQSKIILGIRDSFNSLIWQHLFVE